MRELTDQTKRLDGSVRLLLGDRYALYGVLEAESRDRTGIFQRPSTPSLRQSRFTDDNTNSNC